MTKDQALQLVNGLLEQKQIPLCDQAEFNKQFIDLFKAARSAVHSGLQPQQQPPQEPASETKWEDEKELKTAWDRWKNKLSSLKFALARDLGQRLEAVKAKHVGDDWEAYVKEKLDGFDPKTANACIYLYQFCLQLPHFWRIKGLPFHVWARHANAIRQHVQQWAKKEENEHKVQQLCGHPAASISLAAIG